MDPILSEEQPSSQPLLERVPGIADHELGALHRSYLNVTQQEVVQRWNAAQHSTKIFRCNAQSLAWHLYNASVWRARASKNKRYSNEVHMAERSDFQHALIARSR
nr:hypothetical protein [Microvirga arabica]